MRQLVTDVFEVIGLLLLAAAAACAAAVILPAAAACGAAGGALLIESVVLGVAAPTPATDSTEAG